MRIITTILLLFVANICCAQTDRVQDLAKAIAKAEGYYKAGTIPNRFNNPGDIRALRGARYPGQIGISKRHYVIFKTKDAGWSALRHQIEKVISGESKVYTVNLTFKQFGKKYASSPIWAKNVSKTLSVSPSTALWEFLDVGPAVTFNASLPDLWEKA